MIPMGGQRRSHRRLETKLRRLQLVPPRLHQLRLPLQQLRAALRDALLVLHRDGLGTLATAGQSLLGLALLAENLHRPALPFFGLAFTSPPLRGLLRLALRLPRLLP